MGWAADDLDQLQSTLEKCKVIEVVGGQNFPMFNHGDLVFAKEEDEPEVGNLLAVVLRSGGRLLGVCAVKKRV